MFAVTVKLLPAQRVAEKVAGAQVSGSTVTVVVAVAEHPAFPVTVTVYDVVDVTAVAIGLAIFVALRKVGGDQLYVKDGAPVGVKV